MYNIFCYLCHRFLSMRGEVLVTPFEPLFFVYNSFKNVTSGSDYRLPLLVDIK